MRHDHPPSSPDVMDLGELLPYLARRMRRLHGRDLEPFGLTPSQFRALGVIARRTLRDGAELRLSELAEHLGIAARSTTEVVDALQDKGLVQRTPSPTDRRATALHLTDDGTVLLRRLRAEASRASREQGADLFAGLTASERTTLTRLLRKVATTAADTET